MTEAGAIVLPEAAAADKEQQPESLESLPENCMPEVAVVDVAWRVQLLSLAWVAKVVAVPADGLVTPDREQQLPRLVLLIQVAAVAAVSMLPAMA